MTSSYDCRSCGAKIFRESSTTAIPSYIACPKCGDLLVSHGPEGEVVYWRDRAKNAEEARIATRRERDLCAGALESAQSYWMQAIHERDALRERVEIAEADARGANKLAEVRLDEIHRHLERGERLAAALGRFAKIDLTGPIGDSIAWDILNARAALAEWMRKE